MKVCLEGLTLWFTRETIPEYDYVTPSSWDIKGSLSFLNDSVPTVAKWFTDCLRKHQEAEIHVLLLVTFTPSVISQSRENTM